MVDGTAPIIKRSSARTTERLEPQHTRAQVQLVRTHQLHHLGGMR